MTAGQTDAETLARVDRIIRESRAAMATTRAAVADTRDLIRAGKRSRTEEPPRRPH